MDLSQLDNSEDLIGFIVEEEDQVTSIEDLEQLTPKKVGKLILNQEEPSSEGFEPRELNWIVDSYISELFGRKAGFFAGAVLAQISIWLALGFLLSIIYLTSFHEGFQDVILSISLLNITIGNFVLLVGSNLIDQFEKDDLNFIGFIHNSIFFIGSGISFLSAHLFRIINQSLDFVFPFNSAISVVVILINIIGSILFVLSLWVLLKLLWRLNQLVFWESGSGKMGSIYSEFTAVLGGFIVGLGGGFSLTRILVLGIILYIPYYLTGSLWWSIIAIAILHLGAIGIFLLILPTEE